VATDNSQKLKFEGAILHLASTLKDEVDGIAGLIFRLEKQPHHLKAREQSDTVGVVVKQVFVPQTTFVDDGCGDSHPGGSEGSVDVAHELGTILAVCEELEGVFLLTNLALVQNRGVMAEPLEFQTLD
jgi:hypothetical protein